jgi:head-tail adaptor
MIGLLKERVALLRRTAVDNERGGFKYTYAPVGEYWAAFLPLSQSEINKYREYQVETNIGITLRRDPDSTRRPIAGDRLTWHDITIEVTGVVDSLYNKDYVEVLGVTLRES